MADVTISGLSPITPTTGLFLPASDSSSTGRVTLSQVCGVMTSSQITTALGYTPYNSSNPAGYITASSLPATQQLAKAWVSFTGVGTNGQPVTTLDKYNVSSVVKNTINSWTINFPAGTFSNANYIVTGCGRFTNNVNDTTPPLFGVHRFTDPTTSACRVVCGFHGGTVEIQTVYAAFFGS